MDQSRDQHTAPLTLHATALGVSPTELPLKIDSNDRSNLDTEQYTEPSRPNTSERDSAQPPLDPAMELYVRNVLRECRELEDSQENGHLNVPSRTFYTLDDLKRLADSREQLRISDNSNGAVLLFPKKHRNVPL